MNNDIVVKQKPGTPQPAPPAAEQSSHASQPQEADKPDPLESEIPEKNPAPEASRPKPVGVIVMAVLISLCLVTMALYIGYNQS